MKGKWTIALASRVLDGSVRFEDAISFVLWRITRSKHIYFEGLHFENPDHILWSLITETFIHWEYTPKGFDIKANDLIVDIGAHKGVFTGFAAKRSTNRILSLEPDLENFRCLDEFIRSNRLANVEARNYAIGPSDGKIRIYRSESSRHSVTGIDQATGLHLREYLEVPCISLDTLLGEFEQVGFLKMDCEGAEYDAIRAASHSTLDKILKCGIEIHSIDNTRAVSELISKLENSFDQVNVSVKTGKLAIIHARKLH